VFPKTLHASLQNLDPIVDLNLGSARVSRVRQPDGLVLWRAGRGAWRRRTSSQAALVAAAKSINGVWHKRLYNSFPFPWQES